jgi:hypothetical protein
MKPRHTPNPEYLRQRALGTDLRKAANALARDARLGHVPGVREHRDDRGECERKSCHVSGRRFSVSWFDRDPHMPHCGWIRNDGGKYCVVCVQLYLEGQLMYPLREAA